MKKPLRSLQPQSPTDRIAAWWRARVDLAPVWAFAAKKMVPSHWLSWIYLLGGAAIFIFGLQVVTGALLLMYYQPTEAAAHESVREIMTKIPYGWLVRSSHVWGAHLFIITVLLHLVTVLLSKAYRRPRELTWISGVLLLFLTLSLGFSGYLLPWNELSYNATLVGTDIAASMPGVGPVIGRILRGGDEVTGEIITRFCAAHVVILPLLFTLVLAVHVAFVQLQGMSLPSGMTTKRVKDHEPFFSEFLLTDASLWLVLLGVIATFAVLFPAEIGPEAELLKQTPKGIKPEWYFLSVYQLLKYVPEVVGVGLLAGGPLVLLLIPFLDRQAARDEPSPAFTAAYLLVIFAAVGLQILAILSPSLKHETEELTAKTFHPVGNTVWIVFLWLVIGFLTYYLQRLRRQNRRIRQLAGVAPAGKA